MRWGILVYVCMCIPNTFAAWLLNPGPRDRPGDEVTKSKGEVPQLADGSKLAVQAAEKEAAAMDEKAEPESKVCY